MENYDDIPKNEPETTNAFNNAISQLQRINDLWRACNLASRNGDLEAWMWGLDTLQRELHYDLIILEEDNKYKKQDLDETRKAVMTARRIAIRNEKKKSLYYKALDLYEKELRKIENISGKGTKYNTIEEDEIF
jgi:hypothetical protein